MAVKRSLSLILIVVVVALGLFLVTKGLSNDKGDGLKRIVIVTIDTLRADHLKSYGYIRETSPFIDKLASEGVRFEKAFTASSHTGPSHATMFTSLYPFEHGLLRNSETLDSRLFTMEKMASELDITTAAFPAVRFMHGKVGFAPTGDMKTERQFTRQTKKGKKNYWYFNSKEVVDRALRWFDSKPDLDDFIVWIHFYDVHQWHGLGNMPKRYIEEKRALGDDKELIKFVTEQHGIPLSFHKTEKALLKAMNGYDARLKFVDDQLKRFYSYLTERGLNDETLWIITSDHGEGLGNHNHAGHGEFIYQEQLHIPLIMHFNGDSLPTAKGSVVGDLARTVDFLPTVMEATGYTSFKKADEIPNMRGRSLFRYLKGDGTYEEPVLAFAQRRPKDMKSFRRTWEEGDLFAMQSLDRKYIYHSKAEDEFFNLETDPFELNNSVNSEDPEEAYLKDQIMEKLSTPLHTGGETDPDIEIDKETLQELQALGYM